MSVRLKLAAEAQALPESGAVLLWGAAQDLEYPDHGDVACCVLQDTLPSAQILADRGYSVVQTLPEERSDAGVVFLPRSKAAARDRIARLSAQADLIFVDGQKTDGVDAILRDVRKRTEIRGSISKAHGKIFWFSGGDFSDWIDEGQMLDNRWHVDAGVFSANAVDAGSQLLIAHLPSKIKGSVVDLGAGWGYLSGEALARFEKIRDIHLVEAQRTALDCARRNVTDPRAQFHWADATRWAGVKNCDAVIMNPPFHSGRASDLELGQSFIQAAARLLSRSGSLWMVANRHLRYEATLDACFVSCDEIGGDNRFKILQARGVRREIQRT